ncbi:hypothetical protein N177_3126 [Lutibaculum baratangense AMV1]|uniref:Uncharacterized protein n=1 Tax=Lutibaculum baratangense AMV1 TaxID=631454 RepID=V4T948_9HYPH|nr:hypothetical protein N177_3126 [Lutibaculum baratangense AMV1]
MLAWLVALQLATPPAAHADGSQAVVARAPDAPRVLATMRGPTFFVLGVWVAPPQEMEKWRARGVNTIVGVGEGVDDAVHHERAKELGLAQIRAPRPSHLLEDLADPTVIAFATGDEPTNFVDGAPRESPDDVLAEQAPWRDAAASLQMQKPIFTNHVGNHIWHENSRIGLKLGDYHARADWLGADTYQIADGRPNVLVQDGFASTYQGHILNHQRLMAPGAPLMSFVQSVAFEPGRPVPTPGELKTQIWSSVVNGASMLCVFSVRLPPDFAWDGTPEPLAQTITEAFHEISRLEDILIDPAIGGARDGEIWRAAPPGSAAGARQLPWPFEARRIPYRGRVFRIVVNLSEDPAYLAHAEWDAAATLFAGHEVRYGFERAGEELPRVADEPEPPSGGS